MTDDPERLLRAHSADPLERELLASVRDVSAPVGAKDQAWQAIAAQLALGAAAGGIASSSAAANTASATSAAWLPSTLAGKVAAALATTVVAGSLTLGGYYAVQRSKPPAEQRAAQPIPPRAQPAASKPAAASAHAATAVPAATTAPAAEPVLAQPEPRREPRSSESLAAESAILTEARAALHAGKPAAAHAALQRLSARFPRGALLQEREVLAIELLRAEGAAVAARKRARAFVAAYPHSPHSAKLRTFLSAP